MSAPLSTNRAAAWEWAQTALLAVNLVWTTLCLGGYRPETMVVTSALTGALLACHFLARALTPAPPAHPAGWLLLPFVIYAAVNAQWLTPVHWLGWRDWFGWAQMIGVFWVVLNGVRSSAPRRALFAVLVTLGVVAVAMGCYQRFVQPDWLMLGRIQADQFIKRASGSFGIPNSLAALLLLLIPPMGALAFRRNASVTARWGCALVAAWLVFGLVLTISRGAWLGLAFALMVWPLAAAHWNWQKRLGVAALALGALLLAGAALYAFSPKVRERLIAAAHDHGETSRPIMWRAAWQLFRGHPATGSGAGSFNVMFEKYRPEQFNNEPQWAHNDYLNTLSDYGAIGFGLFFGVAALIAWRCWRGLRTRSGTSDDDWLDATSTVAALGIGVLAFALQLVVDFHFKIPALAMTFATVTALLVQRAWRINDASVAPSRAVAATRIGAALAVMGFSVGLTVPRFRAEALRSGARQRIDRLAGVSSEAPGYRDKLMTSRVELARAVALDSANAQAWADVAYTASLLARLTPGELPALAAEAESAASRAVALSPASAEFWIRRGVAHDMQGRWLEGSVDLVQATNLAPSASWVWFYYADHLSRRPPERGLAEAALAFCLRLDPGNPDGLALRQRLAISSKAAP